MPKLTKITLNYPRKGLEDFTRQIIDTLLNDKLSDKFSITLIVEDCVISIVEGGV